jgi:hypothetical protein
VIRNNYGGLPRRVEYELAERGRKLIPLLDALMRAGQVLECNQCEDRKMSAGYYCDFCPEKREQTILVPEFESVIEPVGPSRRPKDDSIVLL